MYKLEIQLHASERKRRKPAWESAGADRSAGKLVDFALNHLPGRCFRIMENGAPLVSGYSPRAKVEETTNG